MPYVHMMTHRSYYFTMAYIGIGRATRGIQQWLYSYYMVLVPVVWYWYGYRRFCQNSDVIIVSEKQKLARFLNVRFPARLNAPRVCAYRPSHPKTTESSTVKQTTKENTRSQQHGKKNETRRRSCRPRPFRSSSIPGGELYRIKSSSSVGR